MHHNFITINNGQLYIKISRQYKDRPTVVFLHDSLGCVQLWRDFPDKLAEAAQCNLLVYDRQGYGRSAPMPTDARPIGYMETEADVLCALLAQLDIIEAILFGHSDGGTIALLAAAKHPERIKAAVCEAAHIFVEEVTLQGIREAMEAYATTNLRERLQKYHGANTDTLFKAWTGTWTRDDFRHWNIERFLPRVNCPLLFIQGNSDEYGTLQQVEKTVAQVSGRAEKHITHSGHTPHKDVPDEVIDVVVQFIKSVVDGANIIV